MTKKPPAPKPDKDTKPDNPEWDAFDQAVRNIVKVPKAKLDKMRKETKPDS